MHGLVLQEGVPLGLAAELDDEEAGLSVADFDGAVPALDLVVDVVIVGVVGHATHEQAEVVQVAGHHQTGGFNVSGGAEVASMEWEITSG